MSARSRGAAALLLAALAGPAAAQERPRPAPGPERSALAEQLFPSIVKVYGAGGFVGVPAYGSGVLVDERGFVLTAWSIALDTPALRVVAHDGRRYAAEVWASDPGLGVALLKIKSPTASFAALRLGDSARLRPGDEVLALGNPFGIIYGDERPALLRGVVTCLTDLSRAADSRLPQGLRTAIVTDVPNNPGTQGGALVTLDGTLVGILGRLVESRATNTIVNFAVPSAALVEFVRRGTALERARPGSPLPPALPPAPAPAESGLRLQRVHLVRPPLAYVERVLPGSPADVAGVRPDDLVFRLDGRTIQDCRELDELLAARGPGERVKLLLKRGDALVEAELVLAAAGRDERDGEGR